MKLETIEQATLALTEAWNSDLGGEEIMFIPDRDTGVITVYSDCSDTFMWGCSDIEPVDTPEWLVRRIELENLRLDNMDVLRKVPKDFVGYSRNDYLRVAGDLWACLKRNMRPQPPIQNMYSFQKFCELAEVDISQLDPNPFEKKPEATADV